MGLLKDLPTAEQLSTILTPILGDEVRGTGVAGVLRLLEDFDTASLSSSLTQNLDQSITAGFSIDTSGLTGGVLDQFQQAMAAMPDDPAALIEPLNAKLESIKGLSSGDLSTQLLAGIDGLQNIESLIPVDARNLVADAAEGMTQLKGEFISGAFGELQQWSDSVQGLYDELQPILAGGAGTLEDRLIAYLSDKMAELVRSILPQGDMALAIAAQLDGALSSDRLAELETIKTSLIEHMNQARIDFDGGNFTNTAHLAAASVSFQRLTDTLGSIAAGLQPVLNQEIATPDGLARALQRQLDDFNEIEIVDLGNIKDKFTNAIGRIQEAIESLDLDGVRETIEDVFTQINDVISQFDLSQLTARLAELQGQLQSVLDALDGALFEAIAAIRNIFTQIKEALQSVASTLGSYDENGVFRFHIQQDVEDFLNGVKATLQNNVRPLLDEFKNSLRKTLQQVQNGLNAVRGQVEGVKAQLQSMLGGINSQLQALDVAGKMETIRQELDSMLHQLGVIDFDPVVDPVIAQIDEMRDALKGIDVSSLNEFTIGALKVSVEVVVSIDFSAQITDALLVEIDRLLEIPRGALDGIETEVEGVLQEFGKLAPAALLAPLDDLFDPITTQLDALDLENLLQPLDAWYDRMQGELAAISPAVILQPLFELFAELQRAFDAISPAELIRPLQAAIDGLKAEIQAIDLSGIAAELSAMINRIKGLLDGISPERLLSPLVTAFDKIMSALDGFDPAVLLRPFTAIFDALTAPLDNLNADLVRLIGQAFAALRNLLDAFDPRRIYQAVQEKFAAVLGLLQQLNIGRLLAELKAPYDAMNASFEANGGPANVSLSASVQGLNPLRNATLGGVVSGIQQFQTRLNALAGAQPPAELLSRFDQIKPRLESLIPSWANENISPASIKRAFQVANPLNITAEINQLYEAIKDQLRNFDPRIIQENIGASFNAVKDAIMAFDPQAIIGAVQGVLDALTQKLEALDLQFIVDDLEDVVDEVRAIVDALNPQPIVDQLESLVGEVMAYVEELRPSDLLSELNGPLQTAKEIVAEFNPAMFKEPLQSVFEEIQSILEAIDVGVILQPLADRLQQLRDELEEGLKRTETAFNGMLAAIPV